MRTMIFFHIASLLVLPGVIIIFLVAAIIRSREKSKWLRIGLWIALLGVTALILFIAAFLGWAIYSLGTQSPTNSL